MLIDREPLIDNASVSVSIINQLSPGTEPNQNLRVCRAIEHATSFHVGTSVLRPPTPEIDKRRSEFRFSRSYQHTQYGVTITLFNLLSRGTGKDNHGIQTKAFYNTTLINRLFAVLIRDQIRLGCIDFADRSIAIIVFLPLHFFPSAWWALHNLYLWTDL